MLAKPATSKITKYDVTESVTLVLYCHFGPTRKIYLPRGLTGPACFGLSVRGFDGIIGPKLRLMRSRKVSHWYWIVMMGQ